MSLSDLTEAERAVVMECLRASVTGPFFPPWEIPSLFGLEHQELADIAFAAVPLDDARVEVRLAINGVMNNLTRYPHRCPPAVWDRHISVPPDEVMRIFKRWGVWW